MCRLVCLSTVLTLATEIPRPCFLRLNYYSEMERYMQSLDRNKLEVERSTDDFLAQTRRKRVS
jgi:hypothetical protein